MAIPRLRILLVDDHAIIAAGIACLIRDLGHEVVDVAETGRRAIASAERHRPDLIIMDVRLDGECDGIEAASQIQKHLAIKSIFFSGYLDRETRERAALAAPLALLDKTASQVDLARVVNLVATERAFSDFGTSRTPNGPDPSIRALK